MLQSEMYATAILFFVVSLGNSMQVIMESSWVS